MRLFLCGIKHCGKSTLGKILARQLNWQFLDSDTVVEKNFQFTQGEKLSCREIFRQYGEEFFRQLEAETLRDLGSRPLKAVIALGGGALSNPFLALNEFKDWGKILYLQLDSRTAFERIEREGLPPFLQQSRDPWAEFQHQNQARIAVFEQAADFTFALSTPELEPEVQGEKIYAMIKQEL